MEDRFRRFRVGTARALLDGDGATAPELRHAIARGDAPPELAPLVHKIRSAPYSVTDRDIDALRGRYSEDQLFEIIVAAAFGASEDRLTTARRALEDA